MNQVKDKAYWERRREKLFNERKKWLYLAANSLDITFATKQADKLTEAINKIDSYLKTL